MAVRQRGKNTFIIRVHLGRDPITKKRIEINETVHGSRSYAEKRETQLKAQKHSGRLAKSPHMSLDALFEQYIDSVRHTVGIATYHQYSSSYQRYGKPYIGQIPIDKIRHGDVQRLFNFMQDPKAGGSDKSIVRTLAVLGLSVGTVKNLRNVLKCAFGFAIDNGLVADNPVNNTKVKARKKVAANSLTVEEAKAFVSAKGDYWYDRAFIFQLHTGLRNQELMALIWDDVDFEKGTLRVERACKWVKGKCVQIGPPKTPSSDRVIYLEPEHLDLLREQFRAQQETVEEGGEQQAPYGDGKVEEWVKNERPGRTHLYKNTNLIFPKQDGTVPSSNSARFAFNGMVLRAGIGNGRRIRWYDLRHTHATLLLSEGVSSNRVAARMGHSIATLLGTYAHAIKAGQGDPSRAFADLIPV